MIRIFLLVFAFYNFCSTPLRAIPSPAYNTDRKTVFVENHFTGRWQGMATTSQEKTQVILDLSNHKTVLGAAITLMDMGVMGWPAKDIQLKGDQILLRFPTDTSDQIIALTLYQDENNLVFLEGTWQDTSLEEIAKIRLQKQPAKARFASESVTIQGPEGSLSAEVIIPQGEGPFPGVVFLHGSGPQPKDTNRFSAYSLAEEGIASIIFDKRGVGQSQGNWQGADFAELARDGIAVAAYFSSLKKIDYIGFSGHSQGGWIGPLAATLWSEAAFVISSAGPAVSPAREAQWSFIYNAQNAGATDADIRVLRKVVEDWHEGLRSGIWKPFTAGLKELEVASWYGASGLQYLQYPPDPAHLKYYLPFMDYDPIPVLQNLDIPLYAILTPDDESIDALETESIYREMMKVGKDIRIKLYPGYNHGFRKIGIDGDIRWPGFPEDYFQLQADFIKSIKISK